MSEKPLRIPLILGALIAFAPMSIDMYLPSLPALARALGTDAASVQLTLAAFFVGLAIGQVLYGPLADRFGRKPPLYAGLALYVAASAGCALATGIESLIVLRFAQAIGGCAGLVISRAVVRDLYEHQESARMFSALMLVTGVAPVLAPLAGGYLLLWLGWRAIFWGLALFGLACLAAAALWLPETRPPHAVGVGLGGALIAYARLLAHRQFVGHALAGGFAMAGMFAYIAGSPFVFIDVYGVPAQAYGWLFGANAAGIVIASQVNRRLLRRHAAGKILAAANAANALFGVVLLALAARGAAGFFGVLVPLFAYLAVLGFVFPNAAAGAMAPFAERAGSASALLGTLQYVLAAAASVVVGAIHDRSALPMSAVIAACGVLALLSHRLLIGRPETSG